MARKFQGRFSGGIISRNLYGFPDHVKYQSGLEECNNFIVNPQGSIVNRPGFTLVRETGGSPTEPVRLIPFQYSPQQTYVIEVNWDRLRFHTNGKTELNADGSVYELAFPFRVSNLFDIHYAQSFDVMTLVLGFADYYRSNFVCELRRLGASSWEIKRIDIRGVAPDIPPRNLTAVVNGGLPPNFVLKLYSYVVTAVLQDGRETAISNEATVRNDLDNNQGAGGNLLTWQYWPIAGETVKYRIYRLTAGVWALLKELDNSTEWNDDGLTDPDVTRTPPIYALLPSGSAASVAYWDQRRAFAFPGMKVNFTRSNTESDLFVHYPLLADDAISLKLSARKGGNLRHLVPLDELLVLSDTTIYRIVQNGGLSAIDLPSVRSPRQIGASNVQPVITNGDAIFFTNPGHRAFVLGYDLQSGGYSANDLSLLASELFDGKQIVDAAFEESPVPILWAVSSDGRLLGLTYIPDQSIFAWHTHTTDGAFESVACVTEGDESVLYAVIKRANGRYIERMESRLDREIGKMVFADCAQAWNGELAPSIAGQDISIHSYTIAGDTYDPGATLTLSSGFPFMQQISNIATTRLRLTHPTEGTFEFEILSKLADASASVRADRFIPDAARNGKLSWLVRTINTLTGLDYLRNRPVTLVVDGEVTNITSVPVSGTIQLDHFVSSAVIGLPYTSRAKTLPLAAQLSSGSMGLVEKKNVPTACLDVYKTRGLYVGTDPDKMKPVPPRVNEPYGSPPNLKSEMVKVSYPSNWDESGQIYIEQRDPLPLTVLSLTVDVAIGG